jgi:branched-subunit amino acid transport protein
MKWTIMILGMAVVTFLTKATLYVLGERVRFPKLLAEALGFVPVTVLTAIIAPMVLAPHGGGLEITLRNPQLVASVAAVAASLALKHQLATIGIGLAVYFGLKLGLGL